MTADIEQLFKHKQKRKVPSYNYNEVFFLILKFFCLYFNQLIFFIFWKIFVLFMTISLLFFFFFLERLWYLSQAFFVVFLYFLDNISWLFLKHFYIYEKKIIKKIYKINLWKHLLQEFYTLSNFDFIMTHIIQKNHLNYLNIQRA